MVEEHSPQFNEVGELQKVDFLEGDVHLGFYDIRFNLDDNKFFNITNDGVVKVRVHTEPGIEKLWILFEDPNFRPIELSKYAKTKRFDYWRVHINAFQDDFKEKKGKTGNKRREEGEKEKGTKREQIVA
jgi:hypothetical protein